MLFCDTYGSVLTFPWLSSTEKVKRSCVTVICFVLGAVESGNDALGFLVFAEGLIESNLSSSNWVDSWFIIF